MVGQERETERGNVRNMYPRGNELLGSYIRIYLTLQRYKSEYYIMNES